MDSLDVVGMIVPPCSSHSTGIDVVRNDVVIVRKRALAEGAHAILGGDLSVHQLAHFPIRTDLPVSARGLRILNAPDAHLARSSFLRNLFSSAARKRTVNWA